MKPAASAKSHVDKLWEKAHAAAAKTATLLLKDFDDCVDIWLARDLAVEKAYAAMKEWEELSGEKYWEEGKK